MTFQTRLFLSALSAALLGLVVAGVLFATGMRRQTDANIERTLTWEAKLAAELLGRAGASSAADPAEIDAEADRMGALLTARVTLIASDGRVVGDSAEPLAALPGLENHASRPEVVAARVNGLGIARRYSETLKMAMLYVAAPTAHPSIAVVRVALPLTDVRQQLGAVFAPTLAALGIALAGSMVIAYVVAGRIGQRVRAIADVARRHRQGDLTAPQPDYGDDELGTVARALDESAQALGGRLAELARDRGRMASILAGMIEGVIVIDARGHLQLVNRAAEHMLKLGTTPIGRHYLETIRHPVIADLVTAVLAGRAPDSAELAPPRDPARTIIARAAAATAGKAHGVVLVLHDITTLKQADQMRRDFVANVSHELRTPLTAIRGYVEALSEGDTSVEDTRRFLDVIKRHTLRMEGLVQDLLRLARLDARQEVLETGPCDVGGLLESVAAELAQTFDRRRQRIVLTVRPGAETVLADPAKIHDALRNLTANASTYAPEGSAIEIVAARVGTLVQIDVLDEGPGIPDEELSRVFERFYRVDKSRGRDPGGTGLGLAIVKHLVELHGGTVSARNRRPTGAQFTITLRS